MSQETEIAERTAKEMWEALGDFWVFLKYVKIVEPPTLGNPGGVIDYQLWPHLRQVIEAFLSRRLIVVVKARQIGLSWTVATYSLWYALSHQGANILLLSSGETEAMLLLSKCYRVYDQLPLFLQHKFGTHSLTEISFPLMMSSIKAFPATETAAIGETASIICSDEWAFHPYAARNYFSIKPTIDTIGGQFIGITTLDPFNSDTLAQTIFEDGIENRNDFLPLFFPYDVVPGRDELWYEKKKREVSPKELQGLTPDLYMFKNYPRSLEEALSRPQSISVFDQNVLNEMMTDVKSPVRTEGVDNLIIHIYQPFHLGEYYIAATDTSHGIGRDYAVTCIMNVKTGVVVADIFSNTIAPEELAEKSIEMLKLYKNPLWFIESNDFGGVTISVAQDLGYKNLGYEDKNKNKVGFNTRATKQGTGTRFELWGALTAAINNHQITILNKDGLKQFYDIIRNVKKEGQPRIEAASGKHDDYPIAVGICWLKKDGVETEKWKPRYIESLHFRGIIR